MADVMIEVGRFIVSMNKSEQKRNFWCFISYRHADNQHAGRQWATWLHQTLETYEVPADLVGRPNLQGEIIPDRIYPVFRDEEELPADADLSRPIISALTNSRCLLVICSPRACESRFVADEIARFKAMGKSDRVIAAIIAGEPNASTDPAKIEQNLVECFPEPLRFEVEEDLSISNRQAEPVAADFRIEETGEEGWVSPQAYRAHMQSQGLPAAVIAERLKIHAKRMELMKLKIIAGVILVDLGELTKRDQAYQLELAKKRAKVLRRWLVAVAVLTLLAVASSVIALRNAHKVNVLNYAQRKNLLEASASAYYQADRFLADANTSQDDTVICRKSQEALLQLARSVKYNPNNETARERYAWELGLRRASLVQPTASFSLQSSVAGSTFSNDGKKILTSEADDIVTVWDAETQQRLATCRAGKQLIQTLDREVIDDLAPYAIFNPDASRFLSVSFEKRVEVWDCSSGKKLHELKHPEFVRSASYSADGKWILTTCDDGKARIWDATTAKMIHALPCDVRYQNANFIADGSKFITLGKSILIYETATGTELQKFEHTSPITAVACSQQGNMIAGLDEQQRIHFWQLPQGNLLASASFSTNVRQLFLSPDGTRLLALLRGNTAGLVDVASGKEIATIAHEKPIVQCSFSNNGTYFATSSWDKTAKIWKLADGKIVTTLLHPNPVNFVSFHPASNQVITSCADFSAKLWTIPDQPLGIVLAHEKPVNQISFSKDGKQLISASSDRTAKIWNLSDATLKHTLPADQALNHAIMSRDGRIVVTTDSEKGMIVWDASSGKRLTQIASKEFVSAVAIHPSGDRIVTAHRDNSARVWDVATGRLVHHLRHSMLDRDSNLNQACYSSSGDFILTAGNDHHAILWDAATGDAIRTFTHGKAIYHCEFSPNDSKILISGANSLAVLWDRSTGKKIHTFTHKDEVTTSCFHPTGSFVACGTAGGDVNVWSCHGGILFVSMPHPFAVRKVMFSADGKRLLTSCNDKIARLWNFYGRSILATFRQDTEINSMAISPDDNTIAIAGGDSVIRLYDYRIPRLVSTSSTSFEVYETMAQAATASEILPNGMIRRLSPEKWSDLQARIQDLSQQNTPEAQLWNRSRPNAAGK